MATIPNLEVPIWMVNRDILIRMKKILNTTQGNLANEWTDAEKLEEYEKHARLLNHLNTIAAEIGVVLD